MKSFLEWVKIKDQLSSESNQIDNSGYDFTVDDMINRAKRLGLKLVVRQPYSSGVKEFHLKDPHMGETLAVSISGDARMIMKAMDEFERKHPNGTAPWAG